MKNKKHKKVEAIEYDENDNPTFNLGASAANDDWIRAARLKREGKHKKLKEMEETPMVYIEPDKEETDDESKKPKDVK
ncbi:MAG: hypothetical protein ACQESX_06105 [Bacteroidota bacterium]